MKNRINKIKVMVRRFTSKFVNILASDEFKKNMTNQAIGYASGRSFNKSRSTGIVPKSSIIGNCNMDNYYGGDQQ